MDVPIHVENGDTTVVRFEGCGLRAPELSYTNLSSSSESVVSEQSMLKRPFPGQVRSLPDPGPRIEQIKVVSYIFPLFKCFSAQRISQLGLLFNYIVLTFVHLMCLCAAGLFVRGQRLFW